MKEKDSVWDDVVAGVQAMKTSIEASPTPSEEAPQKVEAVARQMTPEEEREWNRKLLEAGRRSRGRKVAWGVDKHKYPLIRVTVDRHADRSVDRSAGDTHVRHRMKRPISRKVHRGAGRIKGVNPFKK